jgi:hypothetical protein
MAVLKVKSGDEWVPVTGSAQQIPEESVCKAYGTFSRTVNSGEFSVWGYGVSSISMGGGPGQQQVNFEVPMADPQYTVSSTNGKIFDGRVAVLFVSPVQTDIAQGDRTANSFLLKGVPLTGVYSFVSYDNFEFSVHDSDAGWITTPSSALRRTTEDNAGKVILYEGDDMLGVCYPCKGSAWSLEEIALKDVPKGRKFKFARNEDLPKDMLFRDAWVADFDDHDGVGMGADEFFKKRGV